MAIGYLVAESLIYTIVLWFQYFKSAAKQLKLILTLLYVKGLSKTKEHNNWIWRPVKINHFELKYFEKKN
jgi:hypothetical protein